MPVGTCMQLTSTRNEHLTVLTRAVAQRMSAVSQDGPFGGVTELLGSTS